MRCAWAGGARQRPEQPYLSDDERRAVIRTVIEEAGGKAPVIAGVTASTRLIAADWRAKPRRWGRTR